MCADHTVPVSVRSGRPWFRQAAPHPELAIERGRSPIGEQLPSGSQQEAIVEYEPRHLPIHGRWRAIRGLFCSASRG